MEQPRLFTAALDGVVVTCHWRYPAGWSVQVRWHREGEDEWTTQSHAGYAPEEIPQLIEDVLENP